MKVLDRTPWEQTVRAAKEGPELLALVKARLTHPEVEGPALDDRRGEGPERVFERMAVDDGAFRLRLEQTIDDYFQGDASAPDSTAARIVILGLLDLVQLLAMKRPLSSLLAWLHRHEEALHDDAAADLGSAVLDALAIAQQPGLAYMRNFWLRWWTSGPKALRPSAFIGLRLHDPRLAAEEIPALLKLAREESESSGPMLQGLWLQPGGVEAITAWIRQNAGRPEAKEARGALAKRLPEDDWGKLPPARLKRELTPLAGSGDPAWK